MKKNKPLVKYRKWTKKEWETHIVKNCHNAYSLAVIFQALCIKEFDGKEGYHIKGLSGTQHELALKLSKLIPN